MKSIPHEMKALHISEVLLFFLFPCTLFHLFLWMINQNVTDTAVFKRLAQAANTNIVIHIVHHANGFNHIDIMLTYIYTTNFMPIILCHHVLLRNKTTSDVHSRGHGLRLAWCCYFP